VRAKIVIAALYYEQTVGAGSRKAARSTLIYPRYSISLHAGLNCHLYCRYLSEHFHSSKNSKEFCARDDNNCLVTLRAGCGCRKPKSGPLYVVIPQLFHFITCGPKLPLIMYRRTSSAMDLNSDTFFPTISFQG
jgi:hypothetical protein